MRRIELEPHVTVEAIEEQHRKARDRAARCQWQIIWLLAQGKESQEVQAVTDYNLGWIRAVARRYNA